VKLRYIKTKYKCVDKIKTKLKLTKKLMKLNKTKPKFIGNLKMIIKCKLIKKCKPIITLI